jgi:hypothetical protein
MSIIYTLYIYIFIHIFTACKNCKPEEIKSGLYLGDDSCHSVHNFLPFLFYFIFVLKT